MSAAIERVKSHNWAGEDLKLYAQRALFWPRMQTLFITDPHWGKGETFRQSGIPIPPGGTLGDLARLTELLAATRAQQLIVLGDFFHTRHSRAPHIIDALYTWREAHRTLEIVLVRGNHDRHAGAPPPKLNITSVAAGYSVWPFICHHEPIDDMAKKPGAYILAGHLHPVYTLRDRDGSQVRLPCFHFGRRQAILPAFASFSGSYGVAAAKGDRVFVVSDEFVVEIP
ncbi:MAG: ligase-associated DNA damage response endonuclease PdeM [Caldilineaceae bacterium]